MHGPCMGVVLPLSTTVSQAFSLSHDRRRGVSSHQEPFFQAKGRSCIASSNCGRGILNSCLIDKRRIGFRTIQYNTGWRRGEFEPCRAWWDVFFGGGKESVDDSGENADGDDSSNDKTKEVKGISPYFYELSATDRESIICGPVEDVDALIDNDDMFRKWWIRRQAKLDLSDARETGQDADRDRTAWEDWLDSTQKEPREEDLGGWFQSQPDWEQDGMPRKPPRLPERGMSRSFREQLLLLFSREEEVEDQLTFEDRVFRFTSQSTAKFVSCLVFFPWLTGLLLHDFVLTPFIDVWCEKAPVISQILDVKEKQKLQMISALKLERQRVRFEAEIGKTPPLSDEELAEHMHEEAVDLREEIRQENRSAFANIWSDAVAGITGFLICLNYPKQVAIMRMTGQRIFTNISDTGKAFIIILCTDIFLGYHSASGWETVIELTLEHYGVDVDQNSVYIFIATVPVTLDVCFKLWVFKYLTRMSPSCAATLKEMKRH